MEGIELDLGRATCGLHTVPIGTIIRIYGMLMDLEVRIGADIELSDTPSYEGLCKQLAHLDCITEARRHCARHIRSYHRISKWATDLTGIVAGEL